MTADAVLVGLDDHAAVIHSLRIQADRIAALGQLLADRITAGNKVLFLGNGGSAAQAQHLAAELVGRFEAKRRALPAIALTVDTSILTSVGNDYGFGAVFTRQVEALARPGDVVVGISTSGNSSNVLAAMDAAAAAGATTVGLSGGTGGKLAQQCEYCIVVPSKVTARIQEGHLVIGHLWCSIVDERLAS